MEKFNEIQTRNDLADYIGVPRKKLSYILYFKGTENSYKSFEIPKKNGGTRQIHAPQKDLKQIQKRLAESIYRYEKEMAKENETNINISHAFEKGKSFITNAQIHKNKRFVINVDLENFFDSFHFGRVRGYFMKNIKYQFPKEVATVIAQIVCYKGKLPQGAPSSPIITNMICNIFDMRLLRLAKKYKLDYTRYADDLSFSTNNKDFVNLENQFLEKLSQEIERAGFSINDKKTRVQYKDSRQEVTGIVVNKKLNVDRGYYKATRAMAHQLYKTGEYTIDGEKKGTVNQLEGRFSFINQLDKYNNQREFGRKQFEDLKGREKTYSKFLFYKYFFINKKPLIITEGKTDVIYLKAALKKMYNDYPELIVKKDKGQFEYKVSFLRRSKRIGFFLNIPVDGADALNNAMKFYTEKENAKYPNYMRYFKENSGRKPLNPVVMLFDNELVNDKKPAGYFAKKWLKEGQREKIKADRLVHIQDNVYMLVTPLVEGYEQTDIEMLFEKEIQEIEIDGRKLDKTGKKDKEKFFNKDIFSHYIMRNYEKISFENFRPMLDDIRSIMELYSKEIQNDV